MTNKEKHFDKASPKKVAKIIAMRDCSCCAYKDIDCGGGAECVEGITKWLSQEAEEGTVHIPQIGNIPKIDRKVEMTEQAYKDILARLDKLEESEYHNAMAIERLEKINEYESNIDDVETKTADEMFEELGYKKLKDGYSYKNEDGEVICISKRRYTYLKTLDRFICGAVLNFITEAEDKAIHKKISELKEGVEEC